MSSKDTLETVKSIREALNKELPLSKDEETDDASAVERCQDLLDRLKECHMTLDILADTMIGKLVSSMKSHAVLGPKAKALVKAWKKIAKEAEQQPATSSSDAAVAETKPKAASNGNTTAKVVAKPPVARRHSSITGPPPSLDNADAEWAGLPPLRQNICKKFFELLLSNREALIKDGINAEAVDQLLAPRAAEVETKLWTLVNGEKKAYTDKARSFVFNLRKNAPLTQQVILGQMPAEMLVKLSSDDLASAETKKEREDQAKKLQDSKRLDWEQANEDRINEQCGIKGDLLQASLFTCGRCKSTKTTSTQKQTRSADEPMTVFVLCLNCGKRWKC